MPTRKLVLSLAGYNNIARNFHFAAIATI